MNLLQRLHVTGAVKLRKTYLKRPFSTDNSNSLPNQAYPGHPRMERIIIDHSGLFNVIPKVKASVSGIGVITPQFLKETAIYCSVIFRRFFTVIATCLNSQRLEGGKGDSCA